MLTEDRRWFIEGIRSAAPAIETAEPANVTVEIVKLEYNPTDYQPEGVALAAIGWACEEFLLPDPAIDIRFDRQENRYDFSLP